MKFEEFLPEEKKEEDSKKSEKIGQEQIYEVITGKQPDWQSIIYELINSEQLDPWDVDIVVLTKKYFEKILELEEKADSLETEIEFYISSKVLLAAALLLRIKSEFLLNKHIKSIDEILFGKDKEEKSIIEEVAQLNEEDVPILVPKTPLPRARRITLIELMNALDKAITTESRRIKKEIGVIRAKKLSEVDFPKFRRIDLKEKIREFYAKVIVSLRLYSYDNEKEKNRVAYSYLTGGNREERLACFLPLLHLSNSQKLWLEQEKHLDEIWIFLYKYFEKNRNKFLGEIEEIEVEGDEKGFEESLKKEDSDKR